MGRAPLWHYGSQLKCSNFDTPGQVISLGVPQDGSFSWTQWVGWQKTITWHIWWCILWYSCSCWRIFLLIPECLYWLLLVAASFDKILLDIPIFQAAWLHKHRGLNPSEPPHQAAWRSWENVGIPMSWSSEPMGSWEQTNGFWDTTIHTTKTSSEPVLISLEALEVYASIFIRSHNLHQVAEEHLSNFFYKHVITVLSCILCSFHLAWRWYRSHSLRGREPASLPSRTGCNLLWSFWDLGVKGNVKVVKVTYNALLVRWLISFLEYMILSHSQKSITRRKSGVLAIG